MPDPFRHPPRRAFAGRGLGAVRGRHFTLTGQFLYRTLPASAGYGDKLRRAIGAADPGAVPGGSTIITFPRGRGPVVAGIMMGPNQDRRVVKGAVFARAE